ncbi:hypothetical protein ESCOCP349B_13610 [Escherichia coli]|nr:DUF2254 domain-containing protein [Escherichia coli]
MISRWKWMLKQTFKKLWFRATLFAIVAIITALLSILFKSMIPESVSVKVGAEAVDNILNILASSMLAVTTFSLSIMVTAYGSATTNVTPRATRLVVEDVTTQNVLATFIGSFLFSLVGIIALNMGAYGERGRVILFIVTLVVIALILITLLRWIQHLTSLGRVGETTAKVEQAAIETFIARARNPCLGGYPWLENNEQPKGTVAVYPYNLFYTKRGKLQVNISQQLGEYGSFYLSGSQQTYWHTDQQDRLLQFGYNTQIKDLSLGVSWNYSKSRGQPDADQVFALNFSLPLNLLLPRSNDSYTRKKNYAWMTSNTSIDNEGHITQNLGLTETLLDDGNLSYSVQQGYNSEGKTANGSASMDYKGAFADARVGYNYSDNGSQQQLNYALSGSLVAHSQGITLGQSLGETNVLIAAPGAENTRVANSTGLKTDWRGYTVVPYATSYRENRIALDAASLKRNVDLENAVVNVVPTKGALVLAEFNAHAGARVLMKTSKQGIPLRFGAIATLDGIQTNSGIIDDDGSLYMSGLPAQGAITVRWGEAPDQICHISYQLTEQQINSAITRMDAICR